MESIGKFKVLVAALAAAVSFAAFGVEWSGEVTPEGDVSEPITLNGEVTVTVASGTTITLSGAISDGATAGSIKLVGGGTLALAAANDFTGGAYIEEGVLDVKTGGALGTGDIIVRGGTTATSQLRFADMDYGQSPKTITFSNAITIENGGDDSHYQLQFGPHGLSGKRQSIKFAGPVVCNGDLYFAIDPKSEFTASASNLSFEFAGGLMANKLITDRSTVAGTFSSQIDVGEIAFGDSGTTAFAFASTGNHIGKISTYRGEIQPREVDALGGAALQFMYAKGTSTTELSMYGCDQTIAWVANQPISRGECLYSGITRSPSATLTITGGVESACFYGILTNRMTSSYRMNLTLDAGNEDFVQAFSNNVHCIRGVVTVKKGTLLFGGATSLTNLPTINVEGGLFKLDTTLDDPLQSLTTVNLGTAGRIDLGTRMVMLDTLTVGGEDVYMATHANYPDQVAEGTVLVRKEVPIGMSYTTTDMTVLGDWEIKVPANSTNVVQVRQTGAGKIIKSGAGTLTFRGESRDSTFTGGVVIEEGRVGVEVDNALGTGEITILGQRAGYTGVCQLDMVGRDVGAGDFTTPTVTISNAVHVTGNTSMTYPAVMGYYQNAKLAGKVTAEQDFCFLDDQSTTYSCADESYSGAQGRVLSLEFGEVEVKGLMMHDGWARFYFDGKVTASALKCSVCRGGSGASNWKASYYFRDDVEFGSITNQARNMWFYKKLTIDGAHVLPTEGKYSSYVQGNLYLRGTASTIGGFSDCVPTLAASDVTKKWFVQPDSGSVTLTLTGVEGEPELTTHYMFNGALSLTLDAPGFTQVFAGRTNTMSGAILVKNGTMKVTGDAKFANVSSLTVEPGASFINESTAQGSLTGLKNLSLATGAVCELGLPAGTTLNLTTLTVDGARAAPGNGYTHEHYPVIPEGVTVNVSSLQPATQVAVWTGAASDGKMSTMGNWLVGGEVPASLDLTSGTTTVSIEGGTEMIPDVEGIRIHSITNNSTGGIFYVGAAGKTLYVDGPIVSDNKSQFGLRGTIAGTKGGVLQSFAATKNGATVVTCINAGGTNKEAVRFAGVTLMKPAYVYVNSSGNVTYVVEGNTTNVLMCAAYNGASGGNKANVGSGSLIEFAGGLAQCRRPMKQGAGVLKISGAATTQDGGYNIEGGTLELACPGNVFESYKEDYNCGIRIGTASDSMLKFDCSYALADNDLEQINFVNSKKATIDFGCTTQLVSRFFGNNTHADSALTGEIGSMLEVKGGTKWETSKDNFIGLTNSVQITGVLGFHYLGNGPTATDGIAPAGSNDVYVLTGKAFATTGNLEVSGGTLELAADATWLNGTNFIARGTGTLKFAAAGQVNGRKAWLHIADNGKVYVPEGVTMRFAAATLNGEWVEKDVYRAGDGKELSAHIEGGGSIRIRPPGLVIVVH